MAKLVYHDPNIRVSQPKSLIVHIPVDVRPYQYKKKTPKNTDPAVGFNRPDGKIEEFLTGYVHGLSASKLEERFARALDFFGMDFIFKFEVPSSFSLPGEGKQIDFIVFDGGVAFPVEIGSSFVHDRPSEDEIESARIAQINAILPLFGYMPITDDSYVEFDRPYDFEDAKDIVAEMFISA